MNQSLSDYENKEELLISQALNNCLESLVALGQNACVKPMPMTCIPLYPHKPFPLGDIVPIGFLLHALKAFPDRHGISEIISRLEDLLREKRKSGLWAFHSDRLITATDSSLVLLGMDDSGAVKSLERFFDGKNGYYPQLWSAESVPDHMIIIRDNHHWCQTDYATTCMVRGLRMKAGLSSLTPIEYLQTGFDQRGGLFFANPYLTDWALAMALGKDEQAGTLCKKLKQEIIESQQKDGSFGCFDKPISTALAVLALEALNDDSQAASYARYWLGDLMIKQETGAKAIPFYSSLVLDRQKIRSETIGYLRLVNGDRLAKINGDYQALSYYEDSHDMISTALIILALKNETRIGTGKTKSIDNGVQQGCCHPRYICQTHAEYIFNYALPPYLG